MRNGFCQGWSLTGDKRKRGWNRRKEEERRGCWEEERSKNHSAYLYIFEAGCVERSDHN